MGGNSSPLWWGLAVVMSLVGCGSDQGSQGADTHARAPDSRIPAVQGGPGLWTPQTPVVNADPPDWWTRAEPVHPWAKDALLAAACQQEHRGFWKRMRPCIWNDGDCEDAELWRQIQSHCLYPSKERIRDAIRRLEAQPPLAGAAAMGRVAAYGQGEELTTALGRGHASAEAYARHWDFEGMRGRDPDPATIDAMQSIVDRFGVQTPHAIGVLAGVDSPATHDRLFEAWERVSDERVSSGWVYYLAPSSDPRLASKVSGPCARDELWEPSCTFILNPVNGARDLLASNAFNPSELLDRWEGSPEALEVEMRACVEDDAGSSLGLRHSCLRVLVGMGIGPDQVVDSNMGLHWKAIVRQWSEHGSSQGIGQALVDQGMLSGSEAVALDVRFPPIHYADWMTQGIEVEGGFVGFSESWQKNHGHHNGVRLTVAHPALRDLQVTPYLPISGSEPYSNARGEPEGYDIGELMGFLNGKRYRAVGWHGLARWDEAYGLLLNRVAEDLDLEERVWMDASDQYFWGDETWLQAERSAGRLAGIGLD